MRKKNKKHNRARIVLRLPDLDHSKSSVLNSLSPSRSRRNYGFAMDQFISWYCSEPRLALNRTVVLRFRLHLESLGLAAATINQRLAAVRRLAYEAADSGPLSPELAAGIRRVELQTIGSEIWKLAKSRAVPAPPGEVRRRYSSEQPRPGDDCNSIGLWLTSSRIAVSEDGGCANPPRTLAIVDLVGKGGHVRTVPMLIAFETQKGRKTVSFLCPSGFRNSLLSDLE